MIRVHLNDGRLQRHSGLRIQLMLSIVVMYFGFGCAALERDLVRDGTIRLEQPPFDNARLSRVQVYEDGGDLVVYGMMGRRMGVCGRVEAQVRVTLRFPDGRTLEETKRAFPPYLPKRRSRKSHFSVRFPGLPPAGTVVRIERPPIPVSTTGGGYEATEETISFAEMAKLELFCEDNVCDGIAEAIRKAAHTGSPDDGVNAVIVLPRMISIRTSKEQEKAV